MKQPRGKSILLEQVEQHGAIRFSAIVVAIGLAVTLHIAVVSSILAQPITVEARSVIAPLYNDALYRLGPGADLFAVYRAGNHRNHGYPANASFTVPGDPPYAFIYRYGALVADTVGRVLALVHPKLAFIGWGLLLETALFAFLSVFVASVVDSRTRLHGSLLLILSTPYFLEVHMGQFTFLTSVIACVALLLYERSQRPAARWAASLLLASSMILKFFPFSTLPALLKHRTALLVSLGTLLAIILFNVVSMRQNPLQEGFLSANLTVFNTALQTGNFGFFYTMTSVGIEWGKVWSREELRALCYAWQFVVLGGVAVLAFRAPADRMVLGASTLMAAFFVVYQDVWEHHYSGIIPLGLLILRGLAREPHVSPIAWVAGWLALVLIALPTPFAVFDSGDPTWGNWPSYQRWLLPLSKSGPLIVLVLTGVQALFSSRRDRSFELGFQKA